MSSIETRPYHHGDLRRALINAARRLLEDEGPEALSLRAVAREAGVSPAAPYHHFKDKNELLVAVADQGYEELADELRKARSESPPGPERMAAFGAAYAGFALHRRALYQIMSNASRTRGHFDDSVSGQNAVVHLIREAVMEASPPGASEIDLTLAAIAALAAIHGLADVSTFKVVETVKTQVGGEQAFLREVLRHLGVFGGGFAD